MADGSASCASAVSIRPSVCAFFLQPINAHCIQLHQWGLFRAYRPTVTQSAATAFDGSYVSKVSTTSTGLSLVGLHGKLSVDGSNSLKISALRSAAALQKYKEIQNSNDPDFATQVLAHFGIKPKVRSEERRVGKEC